VLKAKLPPADPKHARTMSIRISYANIRSHYLKLSRDLELINKDGPSQKQEKSMILQSRSIARHLFAPMTIQYCDLEHGLFDNCIPAALRLQMRVFTHPPRLHSSQDLHDHNKHEPSDTLNVHTGIKKPTPSLGARTYTLSLLSI